MRASAYILITAIAGKVREVMDQIMELREVSHVDSVLGPYDLIVTLTGADYHKIGRLIIEKIHSIPGVERTVTCNVIDFEE